MKDSNASTSVTGDLDIKAFSSTLSIFVWGLIMAKAKTGFNAASSKDKEAVGSSFKRLISLVFFLSIATFAKMNADFKYLESWVSDATGGLWAAPSQTDQSDLSESSKRILKGVNF